MSEVKLVGVSVRPTENPDYVSVFPEYSGVDRPLASGVQVHKKHLARLCAAIFAGVAYKFREVRTDVYGKTYVDTEHNVMGKYMESSLKKLGF